MRGIPPFCEKGEQMHSQADQFQERVHILNGKTWQVMPLRVSEPLHVLHENTFIYAQGMPKAVLKMADL